MTTPQTYRCLTCGLQRTEPGASSDDSFYCRACGGAAFLVGTLAPPPVEVHLRRMRVDDALLKLDKYLNTAFLAGLVQVRIVHGKGTGTIRKVVRDLLDNHPLVASYRDAALEEGGWGVTIALLALS